MQERDPVLVRRLLRKAIGRQQQGAHNACNVATHNAANRMHDGPPCCVDKHWLYDAALLRYLITIVFLYAP